MAAHGRSPGKETTCFWCGERLPGVVQPQRPAVPKAKPAKPVEVPRETPGLWAEAPLPAAPPNPTAAASLPNMVRLRNEVDPAVEQEGEGELVPGTSLTAELRNLDVAAAAAFFIGSLALFLASVPGVSFLTKPLSLVGLLLAVFGSLLPALRRSANLGLPAFITGLSLIVLLFVGSWPKGPPPPPPPIVATALNRGTGTSQAAKEDEWVDASTSAIVRDFLRVQIVSARVAGVEVKTRSSKFITKDKFLQIRLRATVEGALFKVLSYEPWNDTAKGPSKNQPVLLDDAKRLYVQHAFSGDLKVVSNREEGDYVTNGRALDDILVYPVPDPNIEYLRLKLPAAAFGQDGDFRFHIPRAMMEYAP